MICEHLKDKDKVTQEVEHEDDGWAVNGCCGGGCYVIMEIIYCPFCGEKIHETTIKKGGKI